MKPRLTCSLLFCLACCSAGDRLEVLASQLDDRSLREQAIDGLLTLVRRSSKRDRDRVKEQVIHALTKAYRDDHKRGQIVAALALLRDPRAEEVFVASLGDADRGGAYFEAAIRSARLIGELKIRRRVPALVAALRGAIARPRRDHNVWLERTLIQALDRLGDRQAVPMLIEVLKIPPSRQDFYLNRMAAAALGRLGDPRAIAPLVASLGATSHGLMLFEVSRRSLCRIGAAAVPALQAAARKRTRRKAPAPGAIGAIRLLGDLGAPAALRPVLDALGPGDPDDFRLAAARSALRLGLGEGEKLIGELLKRADTPFHSRREAAELSGWYGLPLPDARLLETACNQTSVSQDVLCWSLALSRFRTVGPDAAAGLDRLLAARTDPATRHYLRSYRARLAAVNSCEDSGCLVKMLNAGDWRIQERAALELGRTRPPGAGAALAGRLRPGHPQVRRAILIGLERLPLGRRQRGRVAALLKQFGQSKEAEASTPGVVSRVLCLKQRLTHSKDPGEKR